jgi:hypothetical protein
VVLAVDALEQGDGQIGEHAEEVGLLGVASTTITLIGIVRTAARHGAMSA